MRKQTSPRNRRDQRQERHKDTGSGAETESKDENED